MKAKPNTDQFKYQKDPTAFLEGGAVERVEKAMEVDLEAEKQKVAHDPRIHREQKIFRLSLDLITTLKRESYERSLKQGSRVTETELVEQALRAFFNI